MTIRLPVKLRRRIMLTPLIDVVFLLVMFFMLSSTFAPLRRLDVTVAGETGEAQSGPEATLLLTIGVAVDGSGLTAAIDGASVAPSDLEAALRLRASGNATAVLLRMRSGTSVQHLVTALETVRAAGLGAVRVLTR